MASVYPTRSADHKLGARRQTDAEVDRLAALETAAEYCADGAVALWCVTIHTGIPREVRREINAAIAQLRRVKGMLREVAE